MMLQSLLVNLPEENADQQLYQWSLWEDDRYPDYAYISWANGKWVRIRLCYPPPETGPDEVAQICAQLWKRAWEIITTECYGIPKRDKGSKRKAKNRMIKKRYRMLTVTLADKSGLKWAQEQVVQHHYLHTPVDDRCSPVALLVTLFDHPMGCLYVRYHQHSLSQRRLARSDTHPPNKESSFFQ